ncbi:hypothetical protein AURDEDRAFT_187931 [Auricularia subglabra TFB-10046 SS5]|nr:hypothetical protein AURDEDRAFT_187931 [Auricularia subglabra TFB-10046 SS5]
MTSSSTATHTHHSPGISRLTQLIGMRSPQPSHAQPSSAAAQGEDEWYIPYRGPYESPKPKSALPAVNATWSGGQGWHGAVTDSDTGWTSASEREDEGGMRGRSSRRRALTTSGQVQRKSFASSVYAPSSSRVSAPSFLSLDDGGIGESPAPPVRSSVLAYYGAAPQPEQSTSASSNHNRWSLFKRQSSHQQPQTPPRSRTNTLQPQSQTQSLPHAYNQYGYLPPTQQAPQERTLRQKSSEPLLSTFGRTATSPSVSAQGHPYARMSAVQISRPLGMVNPPQGGTFQATSQQHVQVAQPPHQQHAFPQHPSSAPPQTSHQPDTHLHHQPATPPQQRLAPPQRGGILRGLKSSLSSPNLRAAFQRLSPSPSHTPPSAKVFEAETWCDALLFPKPRFRAHVVSPPPSPQQEVLRERREDVHPIEKIGEEVDREERLSRQGTRLRKRSHTLRPSASTANLRPPPEPPKTLDKVLQEGTELDKERSQWDKQARKSFANKRSRSLSRSALRNAKVRVQQADFLDEYPAATVPPDEGKTRGLEKLAVVAFAQGAGRVPTVAGSSAHTTSRRGEDSHHTRSGGSRSGHSRTTSLGTNPTQSQTHSHRRSESWGRAALKKAGKASNCFDPAESPTPTTERGHEADIEKALMSGGTVRLKVRSRVSEDEREREVLEIAPSPPVSATHPRATPQSRATPSPVVGLAVSTPEPPEIVIHAHPYSPHTHSHAHNHSITSSLNSNSIAARHRLPPQAPDEKDRDPGTRMYALSRSGVIREVHARELAASPMASPLRERMPAHIQPPASPSVHSLTASPSQWGVDRTADLPFIEVDPAEVSGEKDAEGRPLSIAPARGGRERNARAYAGQADRTSTLGVEEVLSMAFRRVSSGGDGELAAAEGTFGGNGVGVEEALAAYARMQEGRALDGDVDMGASTPALTRAPSEEAGQTLASSKLLRSDPSLGNLLSREPSGVKSRSTPALLEEDERKLSEDSLGASSRSSPKVSPRPLGSMDDLELYHDLFWDPNSETARPLGHARSGSALGLAVSSATGHSRSPSGGASGGRAGSVGGPDRRARSPSNAGHQRTESAGGRARSPSNAHARNESFSASTTNLHANGTHTHTRNNSTSSAKVPFIARQPRPSYSPTRREYSPTRHEYDRSPAIRAEQDGYFEEPPKRAGRSRSGTFGSTYRRDVPRDVELESEEEEHAVHIQEVRPLVHAINVTTPRPDEEIRSAHPSLTLSPDGGTLSLSYDPPSALDVHLEIAARASSQFAPDPRLSAVDPRHSQLTRASYATTASSNNLSLIADFPEPPTQELMSRAVLGYFAGQNAHSHPLRDDESSAHYKVASEESLPGRLRGGSEEHLRLRGGDGETPRGVYGSAPAIGEEDGEEDEYFPHAPGRERRDLPLPSMARTNRSTFGGEGELADAWEAHRARYD